MTTEEEPTVQSLANDSYDAVKELGRAIPFNCPAPMAYSVIGNVKHTGGYLMAHVLDKLEEGLSRSLIDFDVYDNGGDPAENVAKANVHLKRAADLARQIASELEEAQSAINQQGYRTPGDRDYKAPLS